MKLSEVFQILEIRNKIIDQKIPIKTSYKLTKFFDQLEKEQKYFNTMLQGIIEEYGVKDEKGDYVLADGGQSIKIKEGKTTECINKVKELNDVEVNLEYTPSFTLDELDILNLEMKYIKFLMPYITE